LDEYPDNLVVAMPPGGLFREYKFILDKRHPDVLTVALTDRAENILARIVFTDDDDNIEDVVLNEYERRYYFRDIKADISYYRTTHKKAKLQFDIDGMNTEDAANALCECILNLSNSNLDGAKFEMDGRDYDE
jgi:shikimate kinase